MFFLYREFRRDRLFAVLALGMACLCVYPLFRTKIVPLADLGQHVALSSLLWDVVFKRGTAATYYRVDMLPMPYWTAYVLLAICERALGVFTGTKVAIAVCVLATPLGAMRLMKTLGRSPRLGLLAFLLVWDFNVHYGWINHVLGVGLSLFALAQVLEAETPRDALKCWPVGIVLALTHVLPFGFFCVAVGLAALFRRRRWHALEMSAIALAAPLATLVPWLIRSFGARKGLNPGFTFDPLDVKLKSLFTYSLGGGLMTNEGVRAAGIAFVVASFGPLLLFLLPQGRTNQPRALAAAPLLAAMLLYFTLPLSVARPVEHWGTYPRFSTLILLGMLFLPNPKLSGAPIFALLPGGIATALLALAVAAQFRAFDAEIAPFYDLMRLVPRGSTLLPLSFDTKFRSIRIPLGESLHTFIAASSGGYDPYLFAQATNPIHYREERRLDSPLGWGRRPEPFSMEKYGKYDYVLVLGQAMDPIARMHPPSTLRSIFDRDRYRLYSAH